MMHADQTVITYYSKTIHTCILCTNTTIFSVFALTHLPEARDK